MQLGEIGMARRRKMRRVTPDQLQAIQKIHDRRAHDLPLNARVAPMVVSDPSGDKIEVLRSLRDDPLGAMHAKGVIDEANYAACRHWERSYERVEIGGARAIDPTREAVDGGFIYEPFTEEMRRAARDLARCGKAMGRDGEAIVRDIVGRKMTLLLAATKRGLSTTEELLYFGHKFKETIEKLTVELGYANSGSKAKKTSPWA